MATIEKNELKQLKVILYAQLKDILNEVGYTKTPTKLTEVGPVPSPTEENEYLEFFNRHQYSRFYMQANELAQHGDELLMPLLVVYSHRNAGKREMPINRYAAGVVAFDKNNLKMNWHSGKEIVLLANKEEFFENIYYNSGITLVSCNGSVAVNTLLGKHVHTCYLLENELSDVVFRIKVAEQQKPREGHYDLFEYNILHTIPMGPLFYSSREFKLTLRTWVHHDNESIEIKETITFPKLSAEQIEALANDKDALKEQDTESESEDE